MDDFNDIAQLMDDNNKHRSRNFGAVIPLDDESSVDKLVKEFNKLDVNFVYAQEELSDLGFRHAQCMLSFKNPRYLSSLRKTFSESTVIIKQSPERFLQYCRKTRTRVEDGWIYESGKEPLWNTRATSYSTFQGILNANSRDEAIEVAKGDPKAFVVQNKSIMSFINEKFAAPVKRKWEPSDFTLPLCSFPPGVYALLFVGESGIGKSHFAAAHFQNPALIGVKEDYKKISEDVDGIILDDVSTKDWQPTTLIRWLDGEVDHTMDVKYASAVIPAGMRRIICLNSEEDFWPRDLNVTYDPQCTADTDPKYKAIARRIVIYDFGSKDLRKDPDNVFNGKIKRIKF